RGLPAVRAIALGAGALLGANHLEPQHVRERIAARFPQAAEIPGRPELDRLLEEAGVQLLWHEESRRYVPPAPRGSLTGSATLTRTPGVTVQPGGRVGEAAVDTKAEAAEELEGRIATVVTEGRFLALTTEPKWLAAV